MAKPFHTTFKETVWSYYHEYGRELPWRKTSDPYRIMVSEMMLQQTQVKRVIPKYEQFLVRFPDMEALARAPLSDVLHYWQGLGYNRRGRWLHQAARNLQAKRGELSLENFQAQKGIGYNTAAAITVYAYNRPHVFIETNIRTVFIHHYFSDTPERIHDKEIVPLVEATLDHENPREWYWALMDYGTYVKKYYPNPARRSTHYARQTSFEGSLRQLRARVLREVLAAGQLTGSELQSLFDDDRVEQALETLVTDGLLQKHKRFYTIPLT